MAEEDVECWEEEMDLETMITSYGIDEIAAQALRSLPEDVLGRVMALGPLTGENPSALIMSRIRNEAEGAVECPDTFVAMVDARAKKAFQEQPEGVQQLIMDEGSLLGGNPSAILMGRIRKAKDTFKKSGGAAATRNVLPPPLPVRTPQHGVKVVAKRKAAPVTLQAAEDVSSHPAALHSLGAQLCRLNTAFWDFDVPRAELMAAMKATLETREAVMAWGEQWPADAAAEEPRRKKARPAPAASDCGSQDSRGRGGLPDGDQEQRRAAVLDEVVRMLGEAGGQMPLQDIGSARLTDLRKGAVGNLSKFLSSRPDVVTVTSGGDRASPLVTLL